MANRSEAVTVPGHCQEEQESSASPNLRQLPEKEDGNWLGANVCVQLLSVPAPHSQHGKMKVAPSRGTIPALLMDLAVGEWPDLLIIDKVFCDLINAPELQNPTLVPPPQPGTAKRDTGKRRGWGSICATKPPAKQRVAPQALSRGVPSLSGAVSRGVYRPLRPPVRR